MFDPLDFFSHEGVRRYTRAELGEPESCLKIRTSEPEMFGPALMVTTTTKESGQNLSPFQVMDLPYVAIAPATVILTILSLLRPNDEINFNSGTQDHATNVDDILEKKQISVDFAQETLEWYINYSHVSVNNLQELCTRIMLLGSSSSVQELLAYFTSILAKYEKQERQDLLNEQVLKSASMRISEMCGRTAQPSKTRLFTLEYLQTPIKLHEPALTADNLGFKTWGSSLVLAEQVCRNYPHYQTPKSGNLRVLELGAGTGLVGIAFACKTLEKLQAQKTTIILTDLPEIVPNLAHNVNLNNLHPEDNALQVIAETLDWNDPSDFIEAHGPGKFDLILIADPVYSAQHVKLIVNMLSQFLSHQGIACLEIPIRDRYAQERQRLWDLIDSEGLRTVSEARHSGVDDWGHVNYIYKELSW
ncbi:LAMI_0H10462g1_1 [Lachancea mirantina]|uniref:LAMI_0H10462g1_1 n=1 Tax=Lachancea mirantina TaxID=1230905 RepID=A0A1G4KH42_9SACH|nr:LAMI_0H10462g1_1 [Lachancea mirantina]